MVVTSSPLDYIDKRLPLPADFSLLCDLVEEHLYSATIFSSVNWRRKTQSRLNRHGFTVNSMSKFKQGAKATVVLADCVESDCVIKWDTNQRPRQNYIKEWYLLSTILEESSIPTPIMYAAEDQRQGEFYHVMEAIDHVQPDKFWSTEQFLPRICRHAGEILSTLHDIDLNTVGGLPGDLGDPVADISGWIQHVRERIQETPAERYDNTLETVADRYIERCQPAIRTLTHRDIMSENILFDADGTVAGLIDWESAAITDPMLDLAQFEVHLCSSFSVFGSHTPDELTTTFRSQYELTIDTHRLRLLKIIENLSLAAGIYQFGHFVPWDRIQDRSPVSGVTFHLDRTSALLERLEESV